MTRKSVTIVWYYFHHYDSSLRRSQIFLYYNEVCDVLRADISHCFLYKDLLLVLHSVLKKPIAEATLFSLKPKDYNLFYYF